MSDRPKYHSVQEVVTAIQNCCEQYGSGFTPGIQRILEDAYAVGQSLVIPEQYRCEASPHQRHEWRMWRDQSGDYADDGFYCCFCRAWRR